jgi:DNA-binding MarR family transcriptional regulator
MPTHLLCKRISLINLYKCEMNLMQGVELTKQGTAKLNDGIQASCETICKSLMELVNLLAKRCLSMKQLEYLAKVKENSGLLFYQLVNKLSGELHVPKSTVRWNISKLRDYGMIIAGNKNSKGIPVELTEKGKIALLVIKENGLLGKSNCPKALFETKQQLQTHGGLMTEQKRSTKDDDPTRPRGLNKRMEENEG